MTDGLTATGAQYGTGVGLIYIFNLIVGTGALTMPAAFAEAGWLVSLILVILLAFTSYVTVTFVSEAMAAANAVMTVQQVQPPIVQIESDREDHHEHEEDEQKPLIPKDETIYSRRNSNYGAEQGPAEPPRVEHQAGIDGGSHFEIKRRVEMGKMAEMYFGKILVKLFYACIIIYLYGDLSIYVAAVPKSLRDTACTWRPLNQTNCNETLADEDLCWNTSFLTRMDAYRIFVGCFIVLLGPFVFFNVQKTKYLQLTTTLARWLAFGIMIVLAVIQLSENKGKGHPPIANMAGVPNLFGVCVYSFMCHHSLPSLITPIKNKSKLYSVLAADYTLILGFYALLSFTGIFTFSKIKDLYTLNFLPDECGDNAVTNVKFFQYFLALFPVFTLSTNFPIIAITLRNNLQTLVLRSDQTYRPFVYALFPIVAVLPPTAVGLATNQVEFLVGITGSYAGAGIQYVVPALLVYYARKHPSIEGHVNPHKSPFGHMAWIIMVLVWAVLCVGFVTVNHIITRK